MRTFQSPLSAAIAAALAVALLAGCQRDAAEANADAAPPPPAGPMPVDGFDDGADAAAGTWPSASAAAMLMSATVPGVDGTLDFAVADGGVRITGTLRGFAPGATHALHVHESGRCEPPKFESAGPHLNPEGAPHGHPDRGPHHAGDLPNQTADGEGSVMVDQLVAGLTIGDGGANDVVGKAVIVHAGADDYTSQPAGNAGDRIACGVISLMTAPPAPAATDT